MITHNFSRECWEEFKEGPKNIEINFFIITVAQFQN